MVRFFSTRKGACVLLACAVLFGLTPWAAAQTDVTTSRISGTVSDASDAPLPGVTVTATNKETGLQVLGVTDERGFYRLLNLPTGTYDVNANLDGFVPSVAENVRLLLGSAPTINFTLQSSSVAETITVTSEVPVIEATNTSVGTTFQEEQIENLPTPGTDFKNLVLLTPETRLDSERGNLSISGQRGINTNVTVDGVDFNNAFFGGTVGGAEGRAPLAISQESIKEFSVITNGASVEFGRSGGGFVNVITKSGTNNLHGSLFYYNQPQSLISNFANGAEPADQEKDQFGGSLGGAIIRDRLFYFLSYDNQEQSITVPVDSSVTNLNPAIYARYPVLRSDPQYVQTRDGNVAFGRLDFQVTPAHRLMARANFTDYEGINGTSGAQNRASTTNGIEGLDSKSYVGQYSGQWSANLLNDLNLNFITEDTPREDKGIGLPEIQLRAPSITLGEVSFLPITSTTERKGLSDTVTYMLNQHVIKGGVEYNDTSIDQVFRGNWRGVYIFANEADLLAGRWNEYRQFGGLGGLTSSEAGRADFGQEELAFFLQDQWFIRPNLTLQAGLRWESLDNPNDPVLNPFTTPNANGSFPLNAQIPDTDNQLSPRLGLSWAPDEKTAIRFSAGRYWSRTPAILFAQLFTSNGLRGTQYNIFASNGLPPTDPLAPGWGANFNPNGVEAIDFTRVPTPVRPGVFAIDPDFENPYTDRITLGAEREILPRTALGLDFTYAEGKQLQRLADINRRYNGATAPNGLPAYNTTATTQPYPFYGRITTSFSDAESEYFGVTATVDRRFENNFSIYGSVTWSEDKDHDSNERNFAGIQAEDFNNLENSWGYSNRDQRWKGVINSVWDTPWWGIGVSGAFRYSTGSPYTAITGVDTNGDGISNTDRPTVNGQHFERNSFRQPDYYSLDVRLSKGFTIYNGDLDIFAECFNCTNASNRFVLGANQTWGTGQTPDPRFNFGAENGVGTPRTFQFGVRYDF